MTCSPTASSNLVFPSIFTHTLLGLEFSDICTISSTVSGKIIGLNDRECGHIGVRHSTYEFGCKIEPPHDIL